MPYNLLTQAEVVFATPGSPFQCHGHHNLLQGSVPCPFSNSIDAALDLSRTCKPCGNRISTENIRGKPLSTQEHHDLIRARGSTTRQL
jgi:hypothetical protein